MTILTAIDGILQLAPVRWALLAATGLFMVATGVQSACLWYAKTEITGLKGQNAEYAAKLTTQNDAIKKAADDMQAMQLQAQTANSHVAELQAKLKKRKVEIREVVLKGNCDEMVQQALDEVRK